MKLYFLFERLWKRLLLRGTAFTGAYRKLSLLYAIEDPWCMDSAREQHRFAQTYKMLVDIAPHYNSILELGAGEGHQSLKLMRLTDDLHGLELSDRAVARAFQRCPAGHFVTGRLEDIPRIYGQRMFDLVTACEVLYYVEELDAALRLIQSRTNRLFVSNYLERAEGMRLSFTGPGWHRLPDISKDNIVWECHIWERSVA